MSKVTTKLQVTLPKALADQYGIRPGDEIDWVPAGDVIRVVPRAEREVKLDVATRLRLFDQATDRQRERERRRPELRKRSKNGDRGWTREELYDRGRAR